eukprot:SAG11_NODE_512_length_8839_cov_5.600572_14_plen_165_part_00
MRRAPVHKHDASVAVEKPDVRDDTIRSRKGVDLPAQREISSEKISSEKRPPCHNAKLSALLNRIDCASFVQRRAFSTDLLTADGDARPTNHGVLRHIDHGLRHGWSEGRRGGGRSGRRGLHSSRAQQTLSTVSCRTRLAIAIASLCRPAARLRILTCKLIGRSL